MGEDPGAVLGDQHLLINQSQHDDNSQADFLNVISRPGVAGAVLQSSPSLID